MTRRERPGPPGLSRLNHENAHGRAATRIYHDVQEFVADVGTTIGTSGWVKIDQDRVDRFADATDDHQWIHVNVNRASAGPFGGTIAHGYLIVSIIPVFLETVHRVDGLTSVLNHGVDRVRFPRVVRVGGRGRGRIDLAAARPVAHGTLVELDVTVELEGADRPACVARVLHLLA